MERILDKPPCHRCRQVKGNKWSREQCKECMPDLHPDNVDAINIYSKVRNQYIVGPRGVISLRHEPIYKAMNMYGVMDQVRCFEKVLTLADHFIGKLHDG